MTIDPKKNLHDEIRRVAEGEAARMVMHLTAASERFNDKDYVRVCIADALEDAYKRIKNWE